MSHRLAATFLQRQAGLGSIQRLDLALLIAAQYQPMFGRIQVQTNHRSQQVNKSRIFADFEGLDQMASDGKQDPEIAAELGITNQKAAR